MPASKKKKADPCDDWEEQDYDSPTNGSVPSPTSDRPSPSNALPSNHQPVSSSSNIHSDAPPDPIEIENSLVWNNANRNPQYVILPANAAHSAVTANRPLVQETMFGKAKVTILKRPKAESTNRSSNNSNSSSSSNLSISLREKAYSEARERIFGSSASSSDDQSPSKPPIKLKPTPPRISRDPSSQANPVAIQRQPNGPASSDQKGFNSRQKSIPT
ncbi:hypothetical protein PGT21_028051 [Puccinia graminis f. sp. tritici]|uniref:SUZ domain-containing protein n=1 Tax=Puccinia graminis f. sp. tritici TaxID=56615 RepID=A0A5B0RQW9_PUCGR|nr:hypothetical protein PGT21_028051 [Puccinia graminis f. sp. tritici]KAA1128376.1 hypothetical protein PGTUg99_016883 [Puccinia graminis f. sp. tritici]